MQWAAAAAAAAAGAEEAGDGEIDFDAELGPFEPPPPGTRESWFLSKANQGRNLEGVRTSGQTWWNNKTNAGGILQTEGDEKIAAETT